MIKLIASDMDGTLLNGFGAKVDPEVFEMIRILKQKGIRFLAASGRQYPNLQRELEPVKHEIDYLCENGCLIMRHGHPLLKETMPDDAARELLTMFMEHPHYRPLVSGESTSYILAGDPWYYHHLTEEVHNDVTEVEDLFQIGEPYFKISALNTDYDEALRDMPKWCEHFRGRLTGVYGGNGYVDFSPLGVSKGSAIKKYMEYLGITPDEVMAFGDNYNDEAMLRSVKYSFAMESAPDDIKEFCYGTTASVRDTMKEWFQDLL